MINILNTLKNLTINSVVIQNNKIDAAKYTSLGGGIAITDEGNKLDQINI